MDKNKFLIKYLPDEESVVSFMNDSPATDDFSDFPLSFHSRFLAKTYVDILCRSTVDPDLAREIARLFLMFNPKPVSYIMLLGKDMKIRDIVNVTSGFRATLSEFPREILHICERYKCKKCILIYNYNYKKGIKKELFDISMLYNSLSALGITLVDAIQCTINKAENIISVYNKKGYIK